MLVQVPATSSYVFLCTKFTFSMSSDDDFDDLAYKAFEDQLYEEESLSGLVIFLALGRHIFFFPKCPSEVILVTGIL